MLAASGCAKSPDAPEVLALPAPGKPFAQFQTEDTNCRDYAHGLTANATTGANQRAVGVILLGAAVGAAAGGGIGSAFGHAGTGALVGAGSGLDVAGSYGLGRNNDDAHTIQRSYDVAYSQCMFANGNLVPGHSAPGPTPTVPSPAARAP